ncbi:DNA cytosine methyltransferase [Pseudomethylobacillus aquaticus]|uniref:DNA (cytosine-5-)-methyltransferase n=1 Tax=Pseudomethylobacillus aquaticus TaxID=2676064 RepID=A0A3N0V595_9PROT|nr:DNA cytosine methyltransferase [Pseudomethylobacillus aquaticus]ROH87980.1 DNA cytosine methyltransferase [Pseudomethylobacillus aquaticus]
MIHPQYTLDLNSELIIDNFAGGGGASTGIELALGRHVDIAINHDESAIAMHKANHPQTEHFCESVWDVNPREVTQGRPVGLVWLSPDCKHFSKAKGGKPVEKRIRGLAWIALRWAATVRPRVIMLENVEEFKTWGPLSKDGKPCKKNKGREFNAFKNALARHGYVIEHRELRGCDYGAPTIRKRLFLIARCDGQPIVWPAQTHGDPKSDAVKAKRLKPWRTATECIDWSIPCPSIFERTKPLADATCRRIAKGIMRYVVEAKEPFIVTNTTGHPGASVSQPLRTVTTGGHHALVSPTLVQTGYGEREGQAHRALDINKPLGTVVGSQKHALVSAFLAKHYTGVVGSSIDCPLGTVTSVDHHSLVTASMIHMGHGEGRDGTKRFSHGIRSLTEPLNTITASGAVGAIVTSHMVTIDNKSSAAGHSPADAPLPTTTTENRHAAVQAFLVKYYGTDQDPDLRDPLHTITTKDRFGLVTVHGETYQIENIGLRMLQPRELFLAQGFPANYIIGDDPSQGLKLIKSDQVRMVGNSVCPPLAEALVRANLVDMQAKRVAA